MLEQRSMIRRHVTLASHSVANGRDGYTLGAVLEVKKEIRVTGLFPEILPVNPYSPQQMSSTG